MKTVTKLLPGCAIALVLAAIAKGLESWEASGGLHLIGASVIALFLGMIVNRFYKPNDTTKPGIRFTSKKILKFAIILLGASLNITTVLTVGKFSLTVMLFTLATCFGLGYFIGKALGLNWKTSSLINAGTGICGGSAIAAIAPVIDATDMDVAYGLSATFLFDMVMVVVFPILGRKLGLSDAAFGLWAGTAVNDTSSVVATGYAFSEAAGDFATMVKLTRTLAIIPTVLVFAAISLRLKKKEASAEGASVKVNMKSVFPWLASFRQILPQRSSPSASSSWSRRWPPSASTPTLKPSASPAQSRCSTGSSSHCLSFLSPSGSSICSALPLRVRLPEECKTLRFLQENSKFDVGDD